MKSEKRNSRQVGVAKANEASTQGMKDQSVIAEKAMAGSITPGLETSKRKPTKRARSSTPVRKTPKKTAVKLPVSQDHTNVGISLNPTLTQKLTFEDNPRSKHPTSRVWMILVTVVLLMTIALGVVQLLRTRKAKSQFDTSLASERVSLEKSLAYHIQSGLRDTVNISSLRSSSPSGGIINHLALDMGATVVEVSPIPQIASGRSAMMCSATSAYAFSSKYPPRRNECWWLPPRSGSGLMVVKLAHCIHPVYMIVQFVPEFKMVPAKVELQTIDGQTLGELIWENTALGGDDQFGVALKEHPDKECVDTLRIRVTGHGEMDENIVANNGTCVHRLILLGQTED